MRFQTESIKSRSSEPSSWKVAPSQKISPLEVTLSQRRHLANQVSRTDNIKNKNVCEQKLSKNFFHEIWLQNASISRNAPKNLFGLLNLLAKPKPSFLLEIKRGFCFEKYQRKSYSAENPQRKNHLVFLFLYNKCGTRTHTPLLLRLRYQPWTSVPSCTWIGMKLWVL